LGDADKSEKYEEEKIDLNDKVEVQVETD